MRLHEPRKKRKIGEGGEGTPRAPNLPTRSKQSSTKTTVAMIARLANTIYPPLLFDHDIHACMTSTRRDFDPLPVPPTSPSIIIIAPTTILDVTLITRLAS